MPAALAAHEAAVLAAPVPERKGRVYPRTLKARAAVLRRRQDGDSAGISQHAQCAITLTRPRTQPPRSATDQRQTPAKNRPAAAP